MSKKEQFTGAELLYQSLIQEKVEAIFGIPGSDMLPVFDEIYKGDKIKFVLTRHEQGAVHAADGYARLSGKPGVCMATSGPGATNLVTGIAAAHADFVPLVAITFNAPSKLLGKRTFQEADIISITKAITKDSYRVKQASNLPQVIQKAFVLAQAYPQCPVLVDIPKDILKQVVDRSKEPTIEIKSSQEKSWEIEFSYSLKKEISQSSRPLFLIGSGVKAAKSTDLLFKIVERFGIPVATTVSAVGAIPESHPLSLQVAGVLGTAYANAAIQEADIIFALGITLESRTTGAADSFAPKARIVHVDIDHTSCGRFIEPYQCIVSNTSIFLLELEEFLGSLNYRKQEDWLKTIALWKHQCAFPIEKSETTIKPYEVMTTLNKIDPQAVIFSGNGHHKYWAMRHFNFDRSDQFFTSARFGSMGFALPGAVGASFAGDERKKVVITGDGDMQMNMQELATAMEQNLDLLIIVMNNGALGAIRQHQQKSYGGRIIGSTYSKRLNIAAIAKAYDVTSFTLEKPKDIYNILHKAYETKGVVLVDIKLDIDEPLSYKISASETLDKLRCVLVEEDSKNL